MEEFRDIENANFYQVSNLGAVRVLDHHKQDKNGRIFPVKAKLLVLTFDTKGYLQVGLGCKNKKTRVHNLVAKSFIGHIEGYVVNHINGIKTDNKVINLELVTYAQNNRHAFDTGLIVVKKGFESPNSKLTLREISQILEALTSGCTGRELARKFNVSEGTISLIKNKRLHYARP
jgi:ATP/maltotriose-dependent transcriptional regulator MalT